MKKEWLENELKLAKKHYERLYKVDEDREDLNFSLETLRIASDIIKFLKLETEDDEAEKYNGILTAATLLKGMPISPITEEDTTYACASCCLNENLDDAESYFVRYPNLHKIEEKNGKTWYHEGGRISFRSIDLDKKGILCKQYFEALIDQVYPIKLPFYAGREHVRVYFKQFSANRDGDDTIILNRAISDQRPGKTLNLYYKVPNPYEAPIQIAKDEFLFRLRKADEEV